MDLGIGAALPGWWRFGLTRARTRGARAGRDFEPAARAREELDGERGCGHGRPPRFFG